MEHRGARHARVLLWLVAGCSHGCRDPSPGQLGPSLRGWPIAPGVTADPLPFTSVVLQVHFCLGSVGRCPCYKLGLLFRSPVAVAEVKQRLYELR